MMLYRNLRQGKGRVVANLRRAFDTLSRFDRIDQLLGDRKG